MSSATIGCGWRSMTPVRAPPGRGLELVDALASRWGTLGGPDGRVVWFELDSALAEAGRVTHPALELTADLWTFASPRPLR
jgi:hypothetical protein